MIFYITVFVYWVAQLCMWAAILFFAYWVLRGLRTASLRAVKTKLLVSSCIAVVCYLTLYCLEALSIYMCWSSGEFNIFGLIGWGCIIDYRIDT